MRIDLEGIFGEITSIHSHHVEFSLWINPQDETDEPDITGSVKWDGCMNWQTNPNCMAHFCSAEDIDTLSRGFKWVREETGDKLETALKSEF